jgi:hypothetical protein
VKNFLSCSLKLALVLILFFASSCAGKKLVWKSKPEFNTVENEYYIATITPVKDNDHFFVSFYIDVDNKSDEELKIDWNKTMYISNGRMNGVFVFKGIRPEDIKNLTIPDDIILPGSKFKKVISPYKTLAQAPVKKDSGDKGFSPGILSNGQNGIHLVIRHEGKEIVEKVTFKIKESKE